MHTKLFCCSVWVVICGLFAINQVNAETVTVENSPRSFTVVAPASWIQQPTTTGSSRIKFSAPSGTPLAECSVIVKEFPGLRHVPQSTFDRQMATPIGTTEIATQLSSQYNNVTVFSTGAARISGYPAQLYNVLYSVGTPAGEIWMRGIIVTTATTPGLVWTLGCCALGKSREEAQKGYSYWQSEIMRFPTNIKIR